MSALQGFRVIELAGESSLLAGKLLADMGADVVLVEPPAGSPLRDYAPFWEDTPGPERSLGWWHYNTSKRGMALDWTAPEGRALLLRLLEGADVLLESCAPGLLAAQLGAAELGERLPKLVHCSLTPFGQAGTRRDEQATDLTLLAGGGPAWSCGYDDHELPPVRGGGLQGYAIGCHYAVLSILTALMHRCMGGEGQHIDVSLHAAANVTTEMATYHWLVQQGTVQRQTGRHAMESITMSTQVRCADGRYVNTGVPPRTPQEYRRLFEWMQELGLTENFPEAVFLEMAGARESIDLSKVMEDQELLAMFSAGRQALLMIAERLGAYDFFIGAQRVGLAVGVVYAPEEAFEDEHFRARGMQVELEHPELGRSFRYPGAPYRFEKTPWALSRRAPLLGEHTAELLDALGVDGEAQAGLAEQGVIRVRPEAQEGHG